MQQYNFKEGSACADVRPVGFMGRQSASSLALKDIAAPNVQSCCKGHKGRQFSVLYLANNQTVSMQKTLALQHEPWAGRLRHCCIATQLWRCSRLVATCYCACQDALCLPVQPRTVGPCTPVMVTTQHGRGCRLAPVCIRHIISSYYW